MDGVPERSYVSAQPLAEWVDRHGGVGGSTGRLDGREATTARRTIYKALSAGRCTLDAADTIAEWLGVAHPFDVWGPAYFDAIRLPGEVA